MPRERERERESSERDEGDLSGTHSFLLLTYYYILLPLMRSAVFRRDCDDRSDPRVHSIDLSRLLSRCRRHHASPVGGRDGIHAPHLRQGLRQLHHHRLGQVGEVNLSNSQLALTYPTLLLLCNPTSRFWLMDCRNISEATKYATELYREAIHVPFMAKCVYNNLVFKRA